MASPSVSPARGDIDCVTSAGLNRNVAPRGALGSFSDIARIQGLTAPGYHISPRCGSLFAIGYTAAMSGGPKHHAGGITSDLALSLVTYIVLGTILGACAIVFHPQVERVIGYRAASVWWVPLVVGYCIWQFLRLRRLRRAEGDFPKISD